MSGTKSFTESPKVCSHSTELHSQQRSKFAWMSNFLIQPDGFNQHAVSRSECRGQSLLVQERELEILQAAWVSFTSFGSSSDDCLLVEAVADLCMLKAHVQTIYVGAYTVHILLLNKIGYIREHSGVSFILLSLISKVFMNHRAVRGTDQVSAYWMNSSGWRRNFVLYVSFDLCCDGQSTRWEHLWVIRKICVTHVQYE